MQYVKKRYCPQTTVIFPPASILDRTNALLYLKFTNTKNEVKKRESVWSNNLNFSGWMIRTTFIESQERGIRRMSQPNELKTKNVLIRFQYWRLSAEYLDQALAKSGTLTFCYVYKTLKMSL